VRLGLLNIRLTMSEIRTIKNEGLVCELGEIKVICISNKLYQNICSAKRNILGTILIYLFSSFIFFRVFIAFQPLSIPAKSGTSHSALCLKNFFFYKEMRPSRFFFSPIFCLTILKTLGNIYKGPKGF